MAYQRTAQLPDLHGNRYWLAEPYKGMLQTLYESEPDPDPVQLFDETPFAAQASQSPMLFRLSPKGELLQRLDAEPASLKGMLLSTDASADVLLAQLRSLLEARFLQGRKALLRFYDPRVASYLLPGCQAQLQARWFGPIQQLVWYGGTWVDAAEQQENWHELSNQHTTTEAITTPDLVLNDEQLEQLVNQGHEHFAWRWHQNRPGQSIAQVVSWVKSGIAAGHNQQDSLTAWLDSRASGHGEHYA